MLSCNEQTLCFMSEARRLLRRGEDSASVYKQLDRLARKGRITKDKARYCCQMPLYRSGFICDECGAKEAWGTEEGMALAEALGRLRREAKVPSPTLSQCRSPLD